LLEVIGVQKYSEFYDTRSSAERASGGILKIGAQCKRFQNARFIKPPGNLQHLKRLDLMFLEN
jgi:hypothetical protein